MLEYSLLKDRGSAAVACRNNRHSRHLESLYDLVEQATGGQVKERIPDYVPGRTRRPCYRRWLRQSILERLPQSIDGVDVIAADSG